MSAIVVSGLKVVFPDGTVGLQDINLTIPSGEFVALVGPSGSGKTTLLRTVAGFIEPAAGSIELGGRDVSNTPPERRHMGMVFQQHAVWPHMSVADNVAYPLRRAGVKRAEEKQRVEQTLTTVGLDGYGDRRPATLSGGQRQRVALARAIVAEPEVLLLDEALSALDEPLRDSLRRELVELTRESNLTTVHVTHDRKEAIAIADRIAVLHDGRLEQFDTPEAIMTSPATAWVASFIADATLLDGAVREGLVEVGSLGMTWPVGGVQADGELRDGESVVVAVLPGMVGTGVSASKNTLNATVTSVLYEVNSYTANLKASGVEFRVRLGLTPKPKVGDRVAITIASPKVYKTESW